ncbi:zinc finger BED domain-containing protein isoform X2 [Eleginops maclovinus]|uniref:zinc finger BED domain-containing protein isoform X2 n=1 Tax=Eleginops maclovinus TaxID=56733 RepID=UPI003080123C
MKRCLGLVIKPSTVMKMEQMEMDSEKFSHEVVLEDEHFDSIPSVNGAAIKSILEGAEAARVEQITHEEESNDRPVKRTQKRNKRSLIWRHYDETDSSTSARCRICSKLQSFEGGSTSNLHRHISKRHPGVFSQLLADRQHSSQSSNAYKDTSTQPETVGATEKQRTFSVDLDLENPESDTLNEAGINSALNGLLEAAEQITHEQASDNRRVKYIRNKRSLIWRHYEHLDSLNAAQCHICMKKLQCFEGRSTSNLHRHLSKRHPAEFTLLLADGKRTSPPNSSQSSNVIGSTSTLPETIGATEKQKQFYGALNVSRASEGEKRVFRREQELIEALRRAQKEEARALEDQRELLEKLRAVNAREAAAEREQIESLRKAQLEEAKALSRQREELQKEKQELQREREELQQERE